jgi:hypothetical protein
MAARVGWGGEIGDVGGDAPSVRDLCHLNNTCFLNGTEEEEGEKEIEGRERRR